MRYILPFLAIGLSIALSHLITRRRPADAPRSPAEYGLPFEEVAFPAADGLPLVGWWIPSPGAQRCIIFLHGYGGSMDPDLQYAPALHAAGFHILMFDFRAHGRSAGNICTVGYLERQDVLGAVDFVRRRGIERIGLLGFSMGGIVAMLTAPICPAVAAVISDGGPPRFSVALAAGLQERGLPRPLALALAWLGLVGVSLRVRANQFHYEPLRWVGRIAPRPLLLIHGDRDPYITPADFAALVAAAGPTAQVWRVPQAGHRTVDQLYPDEYRARIVAFFDRALPP